MNEIEDYSIELLNEHSCDKEYMEFIVNVPEASLATDLIVFFSNCTLSARITAESQVQDMVLLSGSNRLEFYSGSDTIKVEIYIDRLQNANIEHMSLSFSPMNAMPVSTDDIIIKNKPLQGYAVAIDFENAIAIAQGFDDCSDIEVQISDPSNQILNIKNSSANFVWKNQTLLCRLPVAIQHRVRIRYCTESGWMDWSDWKKFVCKRKMSL